MGTRVQLEMPPPEVTDRFEVHEKLIQTERNVWQGLTKNI